MPFPQEVYSERYGVMYYKASKSIGIRQKFEGKNQCISFGGKKLDLSEESLRGFADDCLRKLNNGETEAAVEKWAKDALK